MTTTDLHWRPDAKLLDVIHRLHLDDALTLLAQLGATDGELDLEASARLLNYVEAHFSLHAADGQLSLEPYGAHIQGNQLFIYQRAVLTAPPAALEVRMGLMHRVEMQMRNQVNLRVGDVVRSLEAHADAPVGWLVIGPSG